MLLGKFHNLRTSKSATRGGNEQQQQLLAATAVEANCSGNKMPLFLTQLMIVSAPEARERSAWF
jgi:hypothetical protein